MSIGIATTTIKIERPDTASDPDAAGYDSPGTSTPVQVLTDHPAAISAPFAHRGQQRQTGEETDQTEYWVLRADPCDLRQFDIVTDLSTGEKYDVQWVVASTVDSFGLEHVHARLTQMKGLRDDG